MGQTGPLAVENSINRRLQVRLTYASTYSQAAKPITCRIVKIGANGMSTRGQERSGRPNQKAGVIDIYSEAGPSWSAGASVVCQVEGGAKILGYHLAN